MKNFIQIQRKINLNKKNKIENVKFVNADIFDDVFNDETFDFIWTNGVLHHTKNPNIGTILKTIKNPETY